VSRRGGAGGAAADDVDLQAAGTRAGLCGWLRGRMRRRCCEQGADLFFGGDELIGSVERRSRRRGGLGMELMELPPEMERR